MNYEMAVLAALVQLEKPTKPSITEKTGISDQRVNLAIKNLRDLLDVRISRIGSNKTGYYHIDAWGAFESGKKVLRKARALNLDRYKNDRTECSSGISIGGLEIFVRSTFPRAIPVSATVTVWRRKPTNNGKS